jgi:hypothetical protein
VLDDSLFDSAQDLGAIGWDQEFGYGRVNAAAAVSAVRQASTFDTEAPWVEIVSPADGAVSGEIPVDVDAGDNVGVVKVELYVNDTLAATDTIAPYGFTLDTSIYSDESVTLEAVADDAAGNSTSSSLVTVTIGDGGGSADPDTGGGGSDDEPSGDFVRPTVRFTNPADGDTLSGTVTVNVSADDDIEVSRIVLLIDGSEVAISYGPTLAYSWTVSGKKGGGKGGGKKGGGRYKTSTSGQSTLSAIATDSGGNMGTARVSVSTQ